MKIWINTITGEGPHDLRNINNLNHYIGMKEIHPESIPELRLMPIIVGVLAATGALSAVLGRRWMLYGWFGLLAVSAIAGLVDFWLWEYDYGHNLNPEAAIKIPGMSYQPPLFGSKMLLNFKAVSLPAFGGWLAIMSGLLAATAVLLEIRRARQAEPAAEEGVASA